MLRRVILVLLVLVLGSALWFWFSTSVVEMQPREVVVSGPGDRAERGELNRNASSLIYTKHARCRMGCRQISEEEVIGILRNGRLNPQKSDMRADPDPKYAIEGSTNDGQEVRVIFAASPRGVVVVTVIDLVNEWKCDCK